MKKKPHKLARTVQIAEITSGWTNYMLDKFNALSDEKKDLAVARMRVCSSCDFMNRDKNEKPINCSRCGCSYPQLTYATGKKCPEKFWPGEENNLNFWKNKKTSNGEQK